jgi:hypothetical protein
MSKLHVVCHHHHQFLMTITPSNGFLVAVDEPHIPKKHPLSTLNLSELADPGIHA